MHRIDGPAAVPGGHFTEGDPNVGTPATVVTAAFLNAVQEELCNVIEATGTGLSKPSNDQLLKAIQSLLAASIPAGMISAFGTATAPAGWLVCDGSVVNKAVYPALFAAIGRAWGAGDGVNSFALPDLRGEFLRGVDAGRGVDPGRSLASSQLGQVQQHKHIMPWGEHGYGGFSTFGSTNTQHHQGSSSTDDDNYWGHTNDGGDYDGQVNPSGVVGNETRPRNVAVLYCIKV